MPDVESHYWSQFWIERGHDSLSDDPQTQVLRTTRGKPIDRENFQQILDGVLSRLDVDESADVLDLCCGNGIFSVPLAKRCRTVHSVDVVSEFVESIDTSENTNITTQTRDIRQLDFDEHQFDRVLLYAAIQYLSANEVFRLLTKIQRWLRPNGFLFLGDIPDSERRWSFFRTDEQRHNYFQGLASGRPIIGTWFASDWLRYAGQAAGFSMCEHLSQPVGFPYAHFRFDMRFHKSA